MPGRFLVQFVQARPFRRPVFLCIEDASNAKHAAILAVGRMSLTAQNRPNLIEVYELGEPENFVQESLVSQVDATYPPY